MNKVMLSLLVILVTFCGYAEARERHSKKEKAVVGGFFGGGVGGAVIGAAAGGGKGAAIGGPVGAVGGAIIGSVIARNKK